MIPIGLTHNDNVDAFTNSHFMAFSQSYYYALISSIVYATISTLLLISTLGSTVFHRYPASFSTLTVPQRTLMLQTISFSLYLALGAGIFASIENWPFTDAIYWALYTLLTIGLGTDFPLTTVLGRMLLIPYAAVGITLVGLVVSSVRGLVLERAKAKVARRHLGKEREKWERSITHRRGYQVHEHSTLHGNIQEKRLMRLPQKLQQESLHALTHKDQLGKWHRAEFELMRYIERSAASTARYTSLASSFVVILIVWSGGSLVFWSCEHVCVWGVDLRSLILTDKNLQNSQGWTYPDSLYFTYTTLLTIGYGDFYPNSSAGKPFFVLWSLISIPAMTVLISNMGDTVVKLVQDVTVWISKWTILPERDTKLSDQQNKKRRKHSIKHRRQRRAADEEEGEGSEQARGDLEGDIEHMGSQIEKFEKEEGTPNSLAARLAREISHLATDLSASPPKKYSWDEWTRWLDMLGERSDGSSSNRQDETEPTTFPDMNVDAAIQPPPKAKSQASSQHDGVNASCRDGENVTSSPCIIPPPPSSSSIAAGHQDQDQSSSRGSFDTQVQPTTLAGYRHPVDEQEKPGPALLAHERVPSAPKHGQRHDWRWTWLSDEGPLFSRKTETEWIMERLCFRLEEVLEDEIREARGKSPPPQKEALGSEQPT